MGVCLFQCAFVCVLMCCLLCVFTMFLFVDVYACCCCVCFTFFFCFAICFPKPFIVPYNNAEGNICFIAQKTHLNTHTLTHTSVCVLFKWVCAYFIFVCVNVLFRVCVVVSLLFLFSACFKRFIVVFVVVFKLCKNIYCTIRNAEGNICFIVRE